MYCLERIQYHALFQFLSLPVYYRDHTYTHEGSSLHPVSGDLPIVSCFSLSVYCIMYPIDLLKVKCILFSLHCILYLSISLVYTQGWVEDIEILPFAISVQFSEILQPNLIFLSFFFFKYKNENKNNVKKFIRRKKLWKYIFMNYGAKRK